MEQVTIGGKNYECEKFGVVELADTLEWMQERHEDKIVKRARKIYSDEFPLRVYEDLQKKVTETDLQALEAAIGKSSDM